MKAVEKPWFGDILVPSVFVGVGRGAIASEMESQHPEVAVARRSGISRPWTHQIGQVLEDLVILVALLPEDAPRFCTARFASEGL